MKTIRYSGRWDALATYNSEVARGIVHTKEYDEKMAQEQINFDRDHKPYAP